MLYLNQKKSFVFVYFIFFFSLIFSACQKDKISDLKNEINLLLSEGKTEEALSLIEGSPYENIRDPDFANLSAKAYCSKGPLGDSINNEIFADTPPSNFFDGQDFFSLSSQIDEYDPDKKRFLQKCLSSFYRSRFDKEGTPLVNFSESQKNNLLRETSLRLYFLVYQQKEFFEFLEIFPYFYPVYPENLGLNYLVSNVEKMRDSYLDLQEQTSFFGHPTLANITKIIETKDFKIKSQEKTFSLSWGEKYEEIYYNAAKERFSQGFMDENWELQQKLLEKIIQGEAKDSPHYYESVLADKLNPLPKEDKLIFIKTAFSKVIDEIKKESEGKKKVLSGLEYLSLNL